MLKWADNSWVIQGASYPAIAWRGSSSHPGSDQEKGGWGCDGKYIELVFVQVSNKEPNIKKTLVNIKPKKEDNADMVVVMEEDVDDEEEEEDFLGGRRIEERRPAEVGFLSHENDSLNISP